MDSAFLMPKISAKFNGITLKGSAKYRWGRLKSVIFNQYLATDTVQDMDIVTTIDLYTLY